MLYHYSQQLQRLIDKHLFLTTLITLTKLLVGDWVGSVEKSNVSTERLTNKSCQPKSIGNGLELTVHVCHPKMIHVDAYGVEFEAVH